MHTCTFTTSTHCLSGCGAFLHFIKQQLKRANHFGLAFACCVYVYVCICTDVICKICLLYAHTVIHMYIQSLSCGHTTCLLCVCVCMCIYVCHLRNTVFYMHIQSFICTYSPWRVHTVTLMWKRSHSYAHTVMHMHMQSFICAYSHSDVGKRRRAQYRCRRWPSVCIYIVHTYTHAQIWCRCWPSVCVYIEHTHTHTHTYVHQACNIRVYTIYSNTS
jgi:hypothetical protein